MAKFLAVLVVVGAMAPLFASTGFNLPTAMRHPVPLFAQEDRTTRDDDTPRADPPRSSHPASRFSIAAWVTPYLRFPTQPDGILGGLGAQGAYMFRPGLGVCFGVSLWEGRANSREDREGIAMIETEGGLRFQFVEWKTGALYFDVRMRLGLLAGSAPVETSVTAGAGAGFGYEFGGPELRGFLEVNIVWLAAINRGDAGWIEVGDANGLGGPHFNLLRFGVRVYL